MLLRKLRTLFLVMAFACIAASCSTVNQSQPPRTATEQLLISRAADHAAERLAVKLPPKTAVFLDTSDFEGFDQKYAIGTLKDRLLKSGVRLVDKGKADVVVEIRSGALSINKSENLIGIPSVPIPIPLTGAPLTTPEIALFKDEKQQGVAKFAMTAYGAKDGALRASSGPVYGFSHRTKWVVLLFISWTTQDILPEDQEPSDDLVPEKPSL